MKTQQIVLASRPKGEANLTNFRTENIEISKIKVDEVLLKGLFYSVDPYMQDRINASEANNAAFQVNEPIEGGVLATVIESKSEHFAVGDIVLGMLPWKEQIITSDKGLQKIDIAITAESYYLGILGMSGQIPYFGLMYIEQPNTKKTSKISEQTLKDLKNHNILNLKNVSKKSVLLKEKFGLNESINYKTTTDLKKAIAELCPQDVDIYFDNVGGEISDDVISSINFNSRLALCGQISLVDSEKSFKSKTDSLIPQRNVTMQGFITGNHQNSFSTGTKEMLHFVKNRKMKFKEKIVSGFEKLPTALLGLFDDKNKRKIIAEA